MFFIFGCVLCFIGLVITTTRAFTASFVLFILGVIVASVGLGLTQKTFRIIGYPPPKESRYKEYSLPPSLEGITTPTEFERTVAMLLDKMGYEEVKHVGGAGDKAIDITCYRDGLHFAVQCKKWTTKVDSRTMQHFCVMMKDYHEIERGIFITSSTFTENAKDIATKFNVELIDGFKLKELMDKYAKPLCEDEKREYAPVSYQSQWSFEIPMTTKTVQCQHCGCYILNRSTPINCPNCGKKLQETASP